MARELLGLLCEVLQLHQKRFVIVLEQRLVIIAALKMVRSRTVKWAFTKLAISSRPGRWEPSAASQVRSPCGTRPRGGGRRSILARIADVLEATVGSHLSWWTMSTTPLPPPDPCPDCGGLLLGATPFCPHCGAPVLSNSQRAQVDAYVQNRIAKELNSRLRDQNALVRELGDKVEDLVWKRIWRYAGLVVALFGVVAWFGYSSFKDITDSAKSRLEPIITDAENRAKQAQKEIKSTSDEVQSTRVQIDALSKEADKQKTRLDSQSGEAARKLAELQRAADKADALSKGYEAKVDASIHRLDAQSTRVERAVNSQAIATAYPNIDTEPYAAVDGRRIEKSQKKPGELWVQVHLTGFALNRQLLSGDKLNQLLNEMGDAGYIAFLGTAVVGGRISGGIEQLGTGSYFNSSVVYFNPSTKAKADNLARIVAKYVMLNPPDAQLVTFPQKPDYNQNLVKIFLDKSGFDAQVFIAAPQ
jgi:F0F1-type ATP synthase membrane subunit b/b'